MLRIFTDVAIPPGAVDPVERDRFDGGRDPVDLGSGKRDGVRVAVHEAYPAPVLFQVCRNAASVNSITRPRRTRAVTLPGGRGERFGHALGAGRRWAQREPGSAGRGLGGAAPGDSGPGTP